MAEPTLVIEVNAKQLKELMRRYPEAINNRIQRIYNDGSIIVQAAMRRNAPVGVTQDLARVERTVNSQGARVYPKPKYAIWVENGRRPGKMPPYQEGSSLAKWVALKMPGVPPFVVARAIAKKGTKPNPFVATTYRQTQPQVIQYAQTQIAQMTQELNR